MLALVPYGMYRVPGTVCNNGVRGRKSERELTAHRMICAVIKKKALTTCTCTSTQ